LIDPSATIMTDSFSVYPSIGRGFAQHHAINHSHKQFADKATGAHVNTAEAFTGQVERALVGVCHILPPVYLDRYLAESAPRRPLLDFKGMAGASAPSPTPSARHCGRAAGRAALPDDRAGRAEAVLPLARGGALARPRRPARAAHAARRGPARGRRRGGAGGRRRGQVGTGNGSQKSGFGPFAANKRKATDKLADLANSLTTWEPIAQCPKRLFGRQAIPMVWDFPEGNVLSENSGSFSVIVEGQARAMGSTYDWTLLFTSPNQPFDDSIRSMFQGGD
jgi:hypothetical protein